VAEARLHPLMRARTDIEFPTNEDFSTSEPGSEVRKLRNGRKLERAVSVESPVRGNWPERLTVLSRVNRLELLLRKERPWPHVPTA
jgi:hypothetical protein